MTIARESQISLETTRFYHCISRCVRQAFLCGNHPISGEDLNHRKQWLLEYIKFLSSIFSIRVCAYAIMSNHYHLVLYVDLESSESWSDEEVFERWKRLFNRAIPDERMVNEWRRRLSDISWFMRCLNETIARDANKEEGCKGRFWEGRFKSQALVDEGALLSCMVYVDLNPIRSKLADTPEDSEFTSIQERIHAMSQNKSVELKKTVVNSEDQDLSQEPIIPNEEIKIDMNLMPFRGDFNTSSDLSLEASLPVSYEEYLGLIDWSGRAIREGKRGAIPAHLGSIFERLNLRESGWLPTVEGFHHRFFRAAGNLKGMKKIGDQWGVKWLKGQQTAQSLYRQAA